MRTRGRSFPRFILRIALALAGVVAGLAAGAFFFARWLGTPEGSQWALAKLQAAALQPRGIHLEFEEAQFRVFSGFRFKGLRLSWGDWPREREGAGAREKDPNDFDGTYGGEFRAALAEAKYSVSLWTRTIDVESLRLLRPSLAGVFETGAQPAAKEPPAPNDAEAFARSLRALDHLLRRPPASVTVAEAVVEGLDVRVKARPRIQGTAAAAKLNLNGLSARAAFALRPGALASDGTFSLPKAAVEAALPQDPGGAAQLISLNAKSSMRWKVDFREERGRWTQGIGPIAVEAEIDSFSARRPPPAARAEATPPAARARAKPSAPSFFSLASLSAKAEVSARAESEDVLSFLRRGEKDALRSVDLQASLEARGAAGESAAPGGKKAQATLFKLASLRADVAGTLGEELALSLRALASQADSPARLRRPVDAGLDANVSLPRDLARVRIDGGAAVSGASAAISSKIELARWDARLERAKGDGDPSLFSANATIFADKRLAPLAASLASLAKMGSPEIQASASGKVSPDGRVDFEASARVPRVWLPASDRPFSFEVLSDGTWAAAERRLSARATTAVDNAAFGRWKASTKTEFALANDGFRTEGKSELAQLQAGPKAPVTLAKPVAIEHRASSAAGGLQARLALDAPEATVPGKATMRETRATIELKAAASAGVKEFSIEASQGRLALDPRLATSPAPLEGAKLSLKASVREDGSFEADDFRAAIGGRLAEASGDARGNYKTKDVFVRLLASAEAPADLPPIAGVRARGRLSAPIEIAVRSGREVSVSGEAQVSGGEIRREGVSLFGISGSVPFSEKLVVDSEAGALRFARVIDQNPFERVNFDRLRPLIQSAQQLTIAKIGWHERSYGPFVGYFSLRQNMLFAHQFDLDLGSGRAYGELFFDAHPKSLRAGLLARLTGLDLGEFLPQRFLGRVPAGDRVVAGRTALVFDLNKNSVDGRVDVAKIGGPQLIALINVLDPKFEDDKLSTMRSLLQVGYPTGAAISMRQGYMDMDVDLAAFGLAKRQSVRGVPLSGFIADKTSEIARKTKKGPLQ